MDKQRTAATNKENPDVGVDHDQHCRIKLQIKCKAERTAMEGFYCSILNSLRFKAIERCYLVIIQRSVLTLRRTGRGGGE